MTDPACEREIFTAALQLPPAERAAFLERACAADPGLRQRVEALLRAHEQVGDFMEDEAPGIGAAAQAAEASIEKPGNRIGRYKLLEKLGEGGCGVVYLAEQEEPVRRHVALKIIKAGMDTKSVIARFEAERQALALMDHPGIARIFDAGTTETGRPYFVMQLVRGVKITTYCDDHALATEERLGLFVEVCQAVQHAHQKGIIHRDLKPSNILVTQTAEGRAQPIVIDFGIAKATTNQPLTDKTLFTAFEMLIGTPAYMSPEQAVFGSSDVDTRTDIYSLGVLLYELLTGTTPIDAGELLKAGLDEVRRVIREEEPVRPSARLSKLTRSDLTTVADRRHAPAPLLIRAVQGDLDWITMKSLEKNRTRRYETASDFARDVQRYLANEAVHARPASTVYRLQKVVLRNKLLFGSLGIVVLVVLASLVLVTTSLVKEREARRETEAALQQARAGVEVAERQALRLRRRLLESQRSPLNTEMFPGIDQSFAEAEAGFREALSVQRRILGVKHPAYIETLESLGLVLFTELRPREAETVLRRVLQMRLELSAADRLELATTHYELGRVLAYERKDAAAEQECREALRIRSKLLGDDDPRIAEALGELVYALQAGKRYDEAERLLLQYVTPEAVAQSQGPELLLIQINYHARRQQWAKAAAAAERAVSLRPDDHRFYHLLAPVLVEAREPARYQAICRQILVRFSATTDPFVADRMAKDCLLLPSAGVDLAVVSQLADTAVFEGKGSVARSFFQVCKALAEFRLGNLDRAIEWAGKTSGTRYHDVEGMADPILAMAHFQKGDIAKARAFLAAARDVAARALPPRTTDDIGTAWQGWIFVQELLDQASAMIEPASPAPTPRP